MDVQGLWLTVSFNIFPLRCSGISDSSKQNMPLSMDNNQFDFMDDALITTQVIAYRFWITRKLINASIKNLNCLSYSCRFRPRNNFQRATPTTSSSFEMVMFCLIDLNTITRVFSIHHSQLLSCFKCQVDWTTFWFDWQHFDCFSPTRTIVEVLSFTS